MYNSTNTANSIKELAKIKGISIKQLLEDCGLNKNALQTMTSRGSMPQADNLAKIADYLDCSVDYLLGREQFVSKEKSPPSDLTENEQKIVDIFKFLPLTEQGMIIARAEILAEQISEKDEQSKIG